LESRYLDKFATERQQNFPPCPDGFSHPTFEAQRIAIFHKYRNVSYKSHGNGQVNNYGANSSKQMSKALAFGFETRIKPISALISHLINDALLTS